MIKVSAIISTYNSEKFIFGCIEDLLNQSLYKKGELEIVIIDSCSLQGEKKIIEKFRKNYRNIVYKRTRLRESMYEAWNRGIKIAKGKYVTNANTDDKHHFKSLEIQSNYLDKHQDISLVYTDCYVTTKENEKYNENNHKQRYFYKKYFAQDSLLKYQFGIHPMWRKKIHNVIGFFPKEIKVAGDYWLNLQIAMYGKAHHINKALGLYLSRGDALSFRDDRIIKETFLLRKHYRNENSLIKIYRNTDEFKNAPISDIYYDMAIRASEYFPAWLNGKSENDLLFSMHCILKSFIFDKTDIKKHLFFIQILKKTIFSLQTNKYLFIKEYLKKYLKSLLTKKNIVFLHPYNMSPNSANGGGASSTISLAEKLVDRGWNVEIYSYLKDIIDYKNGVKYTPISNKKYFKKIINSRVCVVVVYDNKLSIIKKFFINKKVIKFIIYHNAIVDNGDKYLKKFFKKFPKYVGVVSNYCIKIMARWGVSKQKIILIPNILSKNMLAFSDKKNDLKSHNKYTICFVGDFTENKRVDYAIKAINKLQDIDKKYNLLVAGIDDKKIIPKEWLNKKWITFLGLLTTEKLVEVYKKSNVIVLPTIIESFGRVSLEASLFGCIPIVNYSGGLPETIENGSTGYAIKNINPTKIVDKILKINSFNRSEISKMREKSIDFAISYSKKTIVDDFLKYCEYGKNN